MERADPAEGVDLRANSSLASVLGPGDLVSGGSGSGLRVPLSWAIAVPNPNVKPAHTAGATSHDDKRSIVIRPKPIRFRRPLTATTFAARIAAWQYLN